MAFQRVLAQRFQLLDERRAPVPRERRGDPDVMQTPCVIEEPEQQRSDVRARTVLVPAEPGHDAIGCALVLDLEHRPLARLVRRVEPLRHDPVEPRAFEPVEPICRKAPIRGRRCEVHGWLGRPEHRFQPGAPLRLRHRAQVLVAEREEVPRDERGRRLGREHVHARRGGMDAEEQRLEGQRSVARDHHLPVDDAAPRERGTKWVGELGKVAVQRLQVT